jgi:hypothetical protein
MLYRLIKTFLNKCKMFANNMNIVCLGTTVDKLFDHLVAYYTI